MLNYNDDEFEARLVTICHWHFIRKFDGLAYCVDNGLLPLQNDIDSAAHALADLMRLHGMPTRNP